MTTTRSGLALLLAAPLLTGCLSQHEYALAPNSAGLVIDIDGAPVAGAQVRYDALEDAPSVRTGPDGAFALDARMGERRRIFGVGGVFADSALVRVGAPGMPDGWGHAFFINGLGEPDANTDVLVVVMGEDELAPEIAAVTADCLERHVQRHALALTVWAGGLDPDAPPAWLTPARARYLYEHLGAALTSGAVLQCADSYAVHDTLYPRRRVLFDIGHGR